MKKYAKVKFDGALKTYDFATDVVGLVKGDKVVVDTRNGLVLAEFCEYIVYPDETAIPILRWLIQKVDVEGLNRRIENEQKRNDLRRKMYQRRKELKELEEFESLSYVDKDMKALLEEYKQTLTTTEEK